MLEEFKITKCKVLKNYNLEITFADGLSGIIDLSHLVGRGVFKIWNNYDEFKKVKIDPITKTVCWNDKIDLDSFKIRKEIQEKISNHRIKQTIKQSKNQIKKVMLKTPIRDKKLNCNIVKNQ